MRHNNDPTMLNFKPNLALFFSIILMSDFVKSGSVGGPEKRLDQDSYIDALHKTHAEDALNCECKMIWTLFMPKSLAFA